MTGDSSTIVDLLQICPGCRAFPHVSMGPASVAIDCQTVGCQLAVDEGSRKYQPSLDQAIAKWNSYALSFYIRPAVIAAMVQAGLYFYKQRKS